jgi:hypothetical protein
VPTPRPAILVDAGRELAKLVEAVVARVAFPDGEAIPVSYSGGVFKAGARVLEPFERALPPNCELRAPLLEPHLGAALHAATLGGHALDEAAVTRLRRNHQT